MKKLYVDFDGVLMDTITPSYQLLHEMEIDVKDSTQVIEFYRQLNWKQMIETAPILNDSIECLRRIKKSGRFDVSILTHVTNFSEIVAKLKFVRQYFDDIDVIPCPKEISKTEMVDVRNAILIDDYSGNLNEWKQAGGIPVKFSTTKKSRNYLSIDHLDQILDIL